MLDDVSTECERLHPAISIYSARGRATLTSPSRRHKEAPTDRLISHNDEGGEGWQLIVLTRRGAEAHRLPAHGDVTIGRGEASGIRIDDGSVSREHAILHVGDLIELEDLGSANGTSVRERPIGRGERATIRAGEFVQIGRALAVLQPVGGTDEPLVNVGGVVVVDPAMRKLHSMLQRVAQGDISVLLLGETGVGKEVVAERLHAASPRREKPLLRLNCSSFSETLLESELFGHEKGAFTGAAQTRPGLLENADGGTVFLDEVGELPPGLQSRLLRVLEDRSVRRVGGSSSRKVDVRFVAATNRDLTADIASGKFRNDLFYRLGAATLWIPPLRERPSEIAPLARRFLADESVRLGRPSAVFAPDAIEWLEQQPWPGNIRELRNAVQRAVLITSGNVIGVNDLRGSDAGPRRAGSMADVARATASVAEPAPSAMSAAGEPGGLHRAVESAEREQIVAALDATHGNQTAAARTLGIGRRTLIDKMIKLGIPRGRRV